MRCKRMKHAEGEGGGSGLEASEVVWQLKHKPEDRSSVPQNPHKMDERTDSLKSVF